MGLEYIGIFIPFVALSIPIVAITLSYRHKTQQNKIRELELQKEILELEIEKQNSKVKLLEEENRKYDKIIKNPRSRAPGYLRFLLEIFAYVGEQIPHTPSFPQQSCGVLNRKNFK